jgi:hypothetical protein
VSLAAGGVAGGVEGFISVCPQKTDEARSRVTDVLVVSFGVCKDQSTIAAGNRRSNTAEPLYSGDAGISERGPPCAVQGLWSSRSCALEASFHVLSLILMETTLIL